MRELTMRSHQYSSSQLSTLGSLFSRSIIEEFARLGRSPRFIRILDESQLLRELEPHTLVSEIFDKVYEILRSDNYLHEYIYKNTIARKILLGRHNLNTATMLSEFRVANRKADLVIINDESTVYEIKTDLDNLERIGSQIEAYTKLFDRVYVVTSPNKLSTIIELIPPEIGVLILNKRLTLSEIRTAQDNSHNIDHKVVYDALRLDEISEILTINKRPLARVSNAHRRSTYIQEFMNIPKDQLGEAVCKALRRTRSKSHMQSAINLVPKSLLGLSLSLRLTRYNISTLICGLATPIKKLLYSSNHRSTC